MRKDIKQYEGFSLIEMLFTIVILSIVMLLVATTLNTVIKTSQTANSKNQARSDVNYIMNTYERLITNSDLEDIKMYNSLGVRKFGFDESGIPTIVSTSLGDVYTNPNKTLPTLTSGNEIHVRLYGTDYWTCIGYFRDGWDSNYTLPSSSPIKYGYIVKAIMKDLGDATEHANCFNQDATITLLHSYSNNIMVKNPTGYDEPLPFDMRYIKVDENNSMFTIRVSVEPLWWPIKGTYLKQRWVTRQLAVSTKALTRY